MRDVPSPALSRDPATRHALEFDELAAILLLDRRRRLDCDRSDGTRPEAIE